MTEWDRLYENANLATMARGGEPFGIIRDGALAVKDGRIAWVGRRGDLAGKTAARTAACVEDMGGAWMLPGLIDCHTHLVYGGNRAHEFEQRLKGVSYAEIAASGGGIASTVRATRAESEEGLFATAASRLAALCAEGVTTVEIKSGYGLDLESERKMLRAARRLGEAGKADVRTTFLGAHALPPEYKNDRAGYIRLLCEDMLPVLAEEGLIDAVDAFCETIAFTPCEVEAVFRTARSLNLPVKLHAEQLSDSGGAALAARFSALSVDHLEYVSGDGIAAMAKAGTIAVLLPGAFYYLRETRKPPVDAFREAGVPIALSTDHNPGSSPVLSPLLMLNMACILWGLTPEEALSGMTRNAAAALGLGADLGTLEAGKRADLAFYRIGHPSELAYWVGGNPCIGTVRG